MCVRGEETTEDIEVLYVDDDDGLLELTEAYLERERDRFSVTPADGVEEALAELDTAEYDVVVSDYQMPGTDGLGLLERLREEWGSSIPFIVFTGQGREEVAIEALNLGADRYLQKGGDPTSQYGVLAQAIEQEVEHHRTRELLERREENLRITLDSIGDGVITTDDDGVVSRMNEVAEEITGWSAEDAVGKPLSDVFDIANQVTGEPVQDPASTVVEEGRTVGLANGTVLTRRDGTEVNIADSAAPIENGDGIRGVVVVFRDVTERYTRRRRQRRQRETIIGLVTDPAVANGDFETAKRLVTERAANVLDVDRVSIWLTESEGEMSCRGLYDRGEGHEEPSLTISDGEYPAYFDALRTHLAIDAGNTHEDPRTAELEESYLQPLGVDALLDGTIRSGGEVEGVVCCEQCGSSRDWTEDERRFVGELADVVRRTLTNRSASEKERALQRTNRRLQSLLDHSPMGVVEWTPSLELERWNETAAELFGASEADVRGLTPEAFLVEGDRESAVEELERLRDHRGSTSLVADCRTVDGDRFTCEWHTAAVVEDGEVTGFVSLVQDVTERERLDELLGRFSEISAMADADFEGRVEALVEAVRENLELDSGRLVAVEPAGDGALPSDEGAIPATGDGDPCADEAFVERVAADGELVVGEDPDRGPDAKHVGVPVEVDGDGDVWGVLCFAGDGSLADGLSETDRRLLGLAADWVAREVRDRLHERELERRNEALEDVVSVLSHDLRTPLATAQGELDLAAETGNLDRLGNAATALERIEELLEDTLALARQGWTVDETTQVGVDELVGRVWGRLSDGEAELAVADDCPTVDANEQALELLVQNLLENALGHAGPDVTVRVGRLDDGGFFVADDGPGIQPEERAAVFDHGYTTDDAGNGFGLAIVDRVVRAHGWELELAESDAGGARFEIRV